MTSNDCILLFAFVGPHHILHNSNAWLRIRRRFRLSSKHVHLRLQPKPASYVERYLSAGAERLWEDLEKLTTISLNAYVEELELHSLFFRTQLLFSSTGGFKCLI